MLAVTAMTHNSDQKVDVAMDLKHMRALNQTGVFVPLRNLSIKARRTEALKANNKSVSERAPAEHVVNLLFRNAGYLNTSTALEGGKRIVIPLLAHKVNQAG